MSGSFLVEGFMIMRHDYQVVLKKITMLLRLEKETFVLFVEES